MIENLLVTTALPDGARQADDRPAAGEGAVFAALLAGLAAPAPTAAGGSKDVDFPEAAPGQPDGGLVRPGNALDPGAVAGAVAPVAGSGAAAVPKGSHPAVVPTLGNPVGATGTAGGGRAGPAVAEPGGGVPPTAPGIGIDDGSMLIGVSGVLHAELAREGQVGGSMSIGMSGASGIGDGSGIALSSNEPAAAASPGVAGTGEGDNGPAVRLRTGAIIPVHGGVPESVPARSGTGPSAPATTRAMPEAMVELAEEADPSRPGSSSRPLLPDPDASGRGSAAEERQLAAVNGAPARGSGEIAATVGRAPAAVGTVFATVVGSALAQPGAGQDGPTLEGGADPLPAGASPGQPGSAPAPHSASGSLPAQAPSAAPPPVRSIPVAQLGLFVVRAASQGISQLVVRLEPAALGRVEISLRFKDDGRVAASFRAQQGDALQILRAEAPAFARLFAEHGIELAAGGLDFGMMQNEANSERGRPESLSFQPAGGSATSSSASDVGGHAPGLRLGLVDLRV